jgi:hypothetical protein
MAGTFFSADSDVTPPIQYTICTLGMLLRYALAAVMKPLSESVKKTIPVALLLRTLLSGARRLPDGLVCSAQTTLAPTSLVTSNQLEYPHAPAAV